MTPKAAEAFAAYFAYGRDRSLEKLAATETRLNINQLKTWSIRYGWQERLKRIAQADLERANEIRREIYLRTLGLYDHKTQDDEIQKLSLNDVHGIHDRVRPQESGVVSVGTGASLTITIGTRPDGPQMQS